MNRLIEAQTNVNKNRADYVAERAARMFDTNMDSYPTKPFDEPYITIDGVTVDEAKAFARHCFGERIDFRSAAGVIQTVDVKGIRASNE